MNSESHDNANLVKRIFVILGGPASQIVISVFLLIAAGINFKDAVFFCFLFPLTWPMIVALNPRMLLANKSSSYISFVNSMKNVVNGTSQPTPSSLNIPFHFQPMVIADSTGMVFALLGFLNLVLVGFNLIPIPPLDAGVLLFEILNKLFGKIKLRFLFPNQDPAPSIVTVTRFLLSIMVLLYIGYTLIVQLWFTIAEII